MKELGSYTIDYEPYFDRWNCVLFFPNPTVRGDERVDETSGSYPAFQHKTCGGVLKALDTKPPRVCPQCHSDTVSEAPHGDKIDAVLLNIRAVIANG